MTEQKRPLTPEELLANLRELRGKLDSLERSILQMRVVQREGAPAAAVPPPLPVPAEVPPEVPAEVPAEVPPEVPPPIPPPPPAELQPPPRPAEEPPAEPPAPKPEGPGLEQRIGTRWMLFAGVAVLLLGGAFFFKYAYDRGWINPARRCMMGAAWGMVTIALGEWALRRKMRLFAAGLFGAGVVWLYKTAYVASPGGLYDMYHLISTEWAFVLMCVITAIGMALSLRSGMLTTAIIALLGAIATPVLLRTGADRQVLLMSYLLVVNAGFLALSLIKRWQVLAPIALTGTVLLFAGWAFRHYEAAKLASTTAFAWGLLALFWAYVAAGVFTGRAHQRLGGSVLVAANVAVAVLAAAICESSAHTHAFAIQMLVMLAAVLAYAVWRRYSALMVYGAILAGAVIWAWFAYRYDPDATAAMCGYAWVYLAMVLTAVVLSTSYRWRGQGVAVLVAAAVMMIAGWIAMRADLPPNAFALQLLALNAVVLVLARWRHWAELGIGVVVWTVAAMTAKYVTWDHAGVQAANFMTFRIWPLFALIVLDVAAYRRRRWSQIKAAQLAVAASAMVVAWLVMNRSVTWPVPEQVMAWQLLALNVIVLGICMWRRWDLLRAGLVCWTGAGMAILHGQWSDTVDLAVFTSQWAWVMFGLISADVLVRAWWRRLRTVEWLDAALVTVSMGVVFGSTYGLLRASYQEWMGIYTASLAVGAIALAIVIRRLADRRRLAYAYLGQGLVLAALAVPIQFDKSTVALAWGIQGAVAVFLAKRLNNKMLLAKGVVVLALAVIHFGAVDMPSDPDIRKVFLQAGSVGISYAVLLAIALSAALLGSAAILRRGKAVFSEAAETILAYVMIVAAVVLFYAITAVELPVVASTWWWLVAAGGIAAVAVWRNADGLSTVGLLALLSVAMKWAVYDTLIRRLTVGADVSGLPVLNWQLAAGVAVAVTIVLCLWQMRYWDVSVGVALSPLGNVLAGLLVIWAGSFEVDRYFQTEAAAMLRNPDQMMHMAYSLWWAIWALVLLGAGFIWSRRELRYLAICILAVTLAKVFIVDMRGTQAIYRILSFIGLGLLLLGGAFVYTRAFRAKAD